MRNPKATALREIWIPKATGRVLEPGIGSGLNLPFYSAAVEKIFGVDPSNELRQIARQKQDITKVEFLSQPIEQPLPLADASIDTIVLTWTLCSVHNPAAALNEMRRVLKPSGTLLFIEHGSATDQVVRQWQNRLTPLWKHACGGCHLNRPIPSLLTDAGFRIHELTTGYLPGPRPMTFTYQGIARL